MIRTLVILLSIICWSCNHSGELGIEEYTKWVESEKSGFKHIKEIDDIKFEVQYQPLDYVLMKKNKNNKNISKQEFEAEKEKMNDLNYFNLRMVPGTGNIDILAFDIASEQQYHERSLYYSYAFNDDIRLISGTDTIAPVVYQLVNNYGLTPYTDFVLAFKMNNEERKTQQALNDKTLIINDKVFGSGQLKFVFSKENINNPTRLLIN